MTLKEYQESVDQWIKTYGVRYFDVKTNMILLMEEIGELARLIAREYGEQSFKEEPKDIKAEIENEMGDVFFVMTCLINQMEMDLEKITKDNFEKKTSRDKERHYKNPKLRE